MGTNSHEIEVQQHLYPGGITVGHWGGVAVVVVDFVVGIGTKLQQIEVQTHWYPGGMTVGH